MATAFKLDLVQDNAPQAFTPAKAALRLVEDERPLPPLWMIAPGFRPRMAPQNPVFAPSHNLEF